MTPIHPNRPARTLVPDEWTAKARDFAARHNIEYRVGDTIADLIERIPKRKVPIGATVDGE